MTREINMDRSDPLRIPRGPTITFIDSKLEEVKIRMSSSNMSEIVDAARALKSPYFIHPVNDPQYPTPSHGVFSTSSTKMLKVFPPEHHDAAIMWCIAMKGTG